MAGRQHRGDGGGESARPEDLDVGTILTVYPAGRTEAVDAPAVVLRVDPQKLQLPRERADRTVDGIVAYSKLCTHAGRRDPAATA